MQISYLSLLSNLSSVPGTCRVEFIAFLPSHFLVRKREKWKKKKWFISFSQTVFQGVFVYYPAQQWAHHLLTWAWCLCPKVQPNPTIQKDHTKLRPHKPLEPHLRWPPEVTWASPCWHLDREAKQFNFVWYLLWSMRPKRTLKWLDATRLAATWEGNQSTHSTVWELISMWFFSDKWFLNSNTQEVNLRNRSEPQPKTVPSVPPICRRWTNSPVSQRCPWALRGNADSHLILGESWRKDPSALTPHRCIADNCYPVTSF